MDNLSIFAADPEQFILGTTDLELAIHSIHEARDAVLLMTNQALRYINIFSDDLDAPLYDHDLFVTAVARVARESRRAMIKILVKDPNAAVTKGHRLIDLCQRLTSYIQVKRTAAEFASQSDNFFLADHTGLLHRQHRERYAGSVNFNAGVRAAHYLNLFDEIWKHSEPEPEFRRLHI